MTVFPIDGAAISFKAEGPSPLLRALPEAEAYPVAALGPLQGAVQAMAGQTLAPVALVAGSALAAASLAVQGHGDVATLAGPRPVSLYLLSVAKSGERKSTVDGLLLAALRDFERAAMRDYPGARQSWQNAFALYKVTRDKILSEAKKPQARAAAEADLAVLGGEPMAPASPDRTVSEPTFEGLTRKFAEGQPSLGLFSDEGGQFLGGFAMNSDNRQKTLAAFNSLWDGAPIRRTRAGDGSVTLYGRRLALHLMVQPSAAMGLLADPLAADIGFLPRCLICQPASTIGTRFSSRQTNDPAALNAFGARLRAILETEMPTGEDDRELKPRLLPLAPDARALLVEFADVVERQQAPGGPFEALTGAASKAAEQAARLAGVLTLWRDLNAPEVAAEAMAGGITLAQFYLSEAARLGNAAVVSEKIDRAERLRKWLLESWAEPEILAGDVVQRGPGRDLRETPTARATLQLLEKHGWLVKLAQGTVVRGASRKESWRIVRGANVV